MGPDDLSFGDDRSATSLLSDLLSALGLEDLVGGSVGSVRNSGGRPVGLG
jgi:hypothetical protein